MKKTKTLLILLLCVVSYSCSDNDLDSDFRSTTQYANLRFAGDEIWDRLGFSYDVTYQYLDSKATKFPVLDIETLHKENPNRCIPDYTTIQDVDYYAGVDALNYLESLSKENGFDASVGSEVNDKTGKILIFSGELTNNTQTKNLTRYEYSSKYTFGRADVYKQSAHFTINASLDLLNKYLTTSFKEDINNYSADKIVEIYGTHVLTDFSIGGVYRAYYRSSVTSTTDYQKVTDIVKAGMKLNLGFFKIGGSSTETTETEKQLNKENKEYSINIQCIGGNTNGLTIQYDYINGPTSQTVNYGEWAKSVDRSNSVLLDINWEKAYPIYYFISDPVKKEEVKQAIIRHLNKKQTNILQLNTLYVYYDKTLKEHITTIVDNLDVKDSRYIKKGVTGYTMKESYPGLNQALYEYRNIKTGYHITTTNPDMKIYDKNNTIERIAGYTYYEGNQPAESLPLWEYCTTKKGTGNGEHYTATNKDYLNDSQNTYTAYSWNLGYVYK